MKKNRILAIFCTLMLTLTLGLTVLTGCAGSGVTFVYNDGKTEDTKVAAQQGTVTLPEDPTLENFSFKGWYTEKDGKGERITSDTRIAGNMTAYAYFEPYVDMTNRNIIEIGGYNGVTEERVDKTTGQTVYAQEKDFALLAELGVDIIYLTYQKSEVYDSYLDWMDKYGIQAYIRDVELNEKLQTLTENLNFDDETAVAAAIEEIKPLVERYQDRSFFRGNFLVDEPAPEQLDMYGKCSRLYREAFPGYFMYVNLLANYYEPFEQESDFQAYVDKAVSLFGMPSVEQDHYPIHTRSTGSGLERYVEAGDYYQGVYYPATVARDTGKDYGNYIWTIKNLIGSENREYAPSVTDLRFEAFNSMALGASKINLFCASTPPSSIGAGQAVIDQSNKTEGLWDNVVQVISEVKSLSSVFNRYLWQDAACCYTGNGYGGSMILALKGSYKDKIHTMSSDTDLMVGIFEEANGDGCAFMLVNNGIITDESDSTVKFGINGALSVQAYVGTQSSALTKGEDGLYTLTLAPGQGAFITVEM